MVSGILFWLTSLIITIISNTGYVGVAALMALASFNIPVSSEAVMVFSGYLAFDGRFNLILIILTGAIGDLIGCLAAYCLGFYGGRPLIEKYGKYIFLSSHELNKTENWFLKYGRWVAFAGRLLPLIRSFSSFPAGLSKMDIKKFLSYSFFGALIWSGTFSVIGFKMAENWTQINVYFRKLDIIIGVLLLILIAMIVKKNIKLRFSAKSSNSI